jgi:site-specific recombinase XerD
VLLSDAIEGFILFRSGGQVSETTVATDKNHLKQFLRFLGECDVADITPNDIRAYMDYHRDRGLSPHTIIRHRAAISCLYNWLEEIGITDDDPTNAVPPPRKPQRQPRNLTEQQIKQLVEYASTTNHPRRDRAITLFLLDSCCRNSEARGVQVPDIDFSTGRVRVIGKGDRERDVFLGKRALSACWLYMKQARPEPAMVGDETFFLTSDGYELGRSGFLQIFSRMSGGLGFRVYPHLLRHVCLLNHLKNGLSLVAVQMLAGHRDIRTTRRYLDALQASEVGRVARRTSPCDNLRL